MQHSAILVLAREEISNVRRFRTDAGRLIANRKGLDRRAVPDERLKNRVQGSDEIPDSVPAATTALFGP
ncbi:hypothetical protein PSPO01_00438 [Paraphaeosphaeria sporulosa]